MPHLVITEVKDLLVAVLVGAVLSSVLAWQYLKLGRTMSNRSSVAYTIPILTLTTTLLIFVVKSSVALSLGLVGALSIVRFRMPVKEAEELAYIFLAIGIGVGLGAAQVWPTAAALGVILTLATARRFLRGGDEKRNLYLNIDIRGINPDGAADFHKISDLLAPHVTKASLKRLDVGSDFVQATLYVNCDGDGSLARAVETLKKGLPDGTTITFIARDDGPVV